MFESDDEDSEIHCIITLDVNCAREVYESLKYRLENWPGESTSVDPISPSRPEGQFGDPTRTDPGMFAGSYFDYLGTGDPSDPRQFYMYGSKGPVGLARADRPVRTDRS